MISSPEHDAFSGRVRRLEHAVTQDKGMESPSHDEYGPAGARGVEALNRDDASLVDRLCQGDEAAFKTLLDRYGGSLLRIAQLYTSDLTVAEDAVQETWMAVLNGIHRFERRSSLKTWIHHILLNRIRTQSRIEARMIPFTTLSASDRGESSVHPDRFLGPEHPRWAGHWKLPPQEWNSESPEQQLLSQEALACIDHAVAELPDGQRAVITLRDIEGWSSEEVCDFLELTDTNQRVLLHRARARVRRALEQYFAR